MASIVDDANGRKRIQFIGTDGRRRAVRLGKATAKQAEAFKVRLERLVSSAILGHPADDETTRWLASIDDVMHAKLVVAGLAAPRQSTQLGPWLEKYLASKESELKPE